MRRTAFAVIVAVAVCWGIVLATPSTGTVRGTVLDEQGKPLAGAQVTARQLDYTDQMNPRSATTDATGHFEISGLAWGKYAVGAQKEDAGYPDMTLAFYSDQPASASADLNPSNATAEVKLELKVKGAVFSGIIVDSVSNDPIRATFLLRRVDHPENFLTIDEQSTFHILMPADADVKVEVSAPGYKTWYSPGTYDWTRGAPLHFKGTDTMKLDIQMDRERAES
jgi:Carboxypeptidase regulatory-like domain